MGKDKIVIKNKESFAIDTILDEVAKRKDRRLKEGGKKDGERKAR